MPKGKRIKSQEGLPNTKETSKSIKAVKKFFSKRYNAKWNAKA